MDAHIEYANLSEAAREGRISVLTKCLRKEINKFDSDGMTAVCYQFLGNFSKSLRKFHKICGLVPSTRVANCFFEKNGEKT